MLILEKLNSRYTLSPRLKAYLGVCYYHDWNFRLATQIMDAVMPQLKVFAPQERSIYYWVNAESHFNQQHYTQAIPLYESMTLVCKTNEKGDAFYKMGMCYLQENRLEPASECLSSALAYYKSYRKTDRRARERQIKTMLKGIKDRLKGIKAPLQGQ